MDKFIEMFWLISCIALPLVVGGALLFLGQLCIEILNRISK